MNLARCAVTTHGGDGGETPLDFNQRVRMNLVRGLWPDDVLHVDVLHAEIFLHDVSGLFLFIDLSAVGHGGHVKEVQRAVGGVVPMPERLFIGGCFGDVLALKHFEKLRRLGKAGTRIRGTPFFRVIHGELPRGCSAHAEAANDHAVFVDGVEFLRVRQSLDQVDLTGEFVCAAVAAIRMQHERIGRGHIAHLLAPLVDEAQLAQGFAAAMTPGIQSGWRTAVILRNHHAVRLHGAVDFGSITAHDQTFLGGPRYLPVFELLRTLFAFHESFMGGFNFGQFVDLMVLERPVHRLVVDFHIRQQISQPGVPGLSLHRRINGNPQFRQALRQRLGIRFRHRHAGRRDRAHIVSEIVFGTIGQGSGDEKKREKLEFHEPY